MPFSSFSLSNAQTKVQIWINSQKFRVLSKNHLLFKSLQNWPFSHWDKRFFLMAISDKVKNTIQTASFGIAALKERVGGTGRMGEEVAVKRNWVKLTFWVNMKLKLPLNYFPHSLLQQQLNPRMLISFTCCICMETHSRRDNPSSCVVRVWLKLVNTEYELVSVLSCSLHALNAHLWCVPTQYVGVFNINFLVKTVLMVLNGAYVGGKCGELWGWDTFHP